MSGESGGVFWGTSVHPRSQQVQIEISVNRAFCVAQNSCSALKRQAFPIRFAARHPRQVA